MATTEIETMPETAEDRVGYLDDAQIRRVLIAVVNSVDAYGAPWPVMKTLEQWSLLKTTSIKTAQA